jgi:hypothetical protein
MNEQSLDAGTAFRLSRLEIREMTQARTWRPGCVVREPCSAGSDIITGRQASLGSYLSLNR